MKRTTIALFLVILFGFFAQSWTYTVDSDYFELIKGELLNLDEGEVYDATEFTVKTKNGKISVPVVSVDIRLENGIIIEDVPFSSTEINKRYCDYNVDLAPYNITGNFGLIITLDISEIPYDGNVIDGAPGSKPNETILLLEYP